MWWKISNIQHPTSRILGIGFRVFGNSRQFVKSVSQFPDQKRMILLQIGAASITRGRLCIIIFDFSLTKAATSVEMIGHSCFNG